MLKLFCRLAVALILVAPGAALAQTPLSGSPGTAAPPPVDQGVTINVGLGGNEARLPTTVPAWYNGTAGWAYASLLTPFPVQVVSGSSSSTTSTVNQGTGETPGASGASAWWVTDPTLEAVLVASQGTVPAAGGKYVAVTDPVLEANTGPSGAPTISTQTSVGTIPLTLFAAVGVRRMLSIVDLAPSGGATLYCTDDSSTPTTSHADILVYAQGSTLRTTPNFVSNQAIQCVQHGGRSHHGRGTLMSGSSVPPCSNQQAQAAALTATIIGRPPASTDSAALGYATGNFWNDVAHGVLYRTSAQRRQPPGMPSGCRSRVMLSLPAQSRPRPPPTACSASSARMAPVRPSTRALLFDSVIRGSSLNTVSMAIPAAVAPASTSASIIAALRFVSTSQNSAVGQLAGTNAMQLASWTGPSGTPVILGRNGSTNATPPAGAAAQRSVQIVGINNLGSTASVGCNDAYTTNTTSPATFNYAGGSIGTTTIFGSGQMELTSFIVGPGLSAAAYKATVGAHYAAIGMAPQTLDQWIADGDSRTEGYGATLLQGYVRQTERLVERPLQIRVTALYGDTMVNRNNNFGTLLAPFYNPNAPRCFITINAGYNDISGGASAATVFAAIQAYAAKALALGPNVHLFVCTQVTSATLSSRPLLPSSGC